jgi:metal-dependent amidase/aminoacylase/carboxypeptidase family protein
VPIKNRLAELMPEIAEWRRVIHMNPELGYDLPKTTAMVEAKLREFGVDEIVTGIGRSGIVASSRARPTRAAMRWACAPTWTRCR